MSDVDTINDAIVDNATGPRRVHIGADHNEVESRPIADLIAASNHLATKEAASSGRSGLKFFKFVPSGGG